MTKFKVLDASTHQRDIDYLKFKADNPDVKGVILRIGFTGWGASKSKQKDAMFEQHYYGFKRVGIPIGVYWYSCATSQDEAEYEARLTLEYIKDKPIDFPIWWDTEDDHDVADPNASPVSQVTIGERQLTDCAIAYCKVIEAAGYYVGIYASTWWFNNRLVLSRIRMYDKWVAHYGVDEPAVAFPYGMHQYTNKAIVGGIPTKVDMNWCHKDYYNIIRNAGLNGWPKGDELVKPDEDELLSKYIQSIEENLSLIKEVLHIKNGGKNG
jgi:GH25 family lysozyme M1 (1,4-beta-N-acetylmuramidase)